MMHIQTESNHPRRRKRNRKAAFELGINKPIRAGITADDASANSSDSVRAKVTADDGSANSSDPVRAKITADDGSANSFDSVRAKITADDGSANSSDSVRAKITADNGSAKSSDADYDSDVSAHAPLSNEAILALFHTDTEESDFSGFSDSED